MAPVIASTNVATNQTNNKSSNKNKKKNKNKNKNSGNVVLVSNDGDNNLPSSSDNHQSKSSSSPSPSSPPPPSKQNNNNGKSLKSNAKSSSDDHLKRKNLDHLLLGGSNKKQKNYDDKHAENYSLQTKRQSSVDEVDNNDKLSSIDNEWNSPILSQFVWLMSGIYFFAFTSFYYQIRGLYGENGVLPLRYYATTFALKNESLTFQSLFVRSPSLVWPIAAAGFSLTTALELVTIFGVILSVVQLFFASFRIAPYYFLQFILYFSVLKTGQRFMSFQWDYFLLETGALAIIASASTIDRTSSAFLHRLTPHPKLLRWPLRWLMFRFMFANGVVKLTSRCPLWWSLRSLDVHFESQCLPTPIAWYAHHLPQNWLHLATALTFVLEIVLPFFFFTPFTSLKIFSFAIQVFFQLSIIATGNYNFFNLLTIVLSLALLDDDIFFVAVNKPKQKSGGSGCFVRKIMESLFVGVITAILAHYTIHYFNISFDESQSFWQGPNTSINFTYEDFNYFLTQAITVAIWLGAASFSLIAIYSLYKSISSPGTFLGGTVHLASTLFYVVTIGYIFSISLVPLAELDTTGSYLRQLPTSVKNWYSASQDLHLVSDYGLFRSMTGEGGRPELIVEGTDDPNSSTWKPYHFQYKPGDLATAPQFNFPHQPRLDWQMWFAALGTYQQNPWLLNFCYRLLTSEPDVLNLLDRSRLPFTTQPPKYLRISRYLYKYTDNFADTAWWRRVSNRHAYLPVVNKESLAEVLKLSQIQLPKVISESGDTRAPFLKTVLDQLYLSFVLKTIPHYVMYTVFLVAILFKVRLWESQRQQLVGNSRSN